MENLSHSFLSFKSEFEENPDITESIGSTQGYRDHFALGFQVCSPIMLSSLLLSAARFRASTLPKSMSCGEDTELRGLFFDVDLQAYLDGRWEEARDLLLSCLNRVDPSGLSCTDGPTASLLEVMGRSDFLAPRSWE